MADKGKKTPEEQHQFADDPEDQTWFRRAVSSGMSYAKSYSERSGLKLLPELELAADDKPSEKSAHEAEVPPKLPPPPPPRNQKKNAARPTEKAAPQKSQFAPERTLFKTAINDFLKLNQKDGKTVPDGEQRYAPSRTGRWIKLAAFTLGLLALIIFAFVAEKRLHVVETLMRLREKRNAVHDATR